MYGHPKSPLYPHTVPRMTRKAAAPLAADLTLLVTQQSNVDLCTGIACASRRGEGPSQLQGRSRFGQGCDTLAWPVQPLDGTAAFASGPWSLATCIYQESFSTTAANWFGRWTYVSEANNTGWQFCTRATNERNRFEWDVHRNNGNALYAIDGGSLTSGFHIFVIASNGVDSISTYKDGVPVTTRTSSVNFNPLAGAGTLWLGLGGGQLAQGQAFWGAGWKRQLSAAEAELLWTNPWMLFDAATPSTPVLAALAAGGGGGARSQAVVVG